MQCRLSKEDGMVQPGLSDKAEQENDECKAL
jgi:hypothetical protein